MADISFRNYDLPFVLSKKKKTPEVNSVVLGSHMMQNQYNLVFEKSWPNQLKSTVGRCLCSVDCTSLYDLVNETNFMHNLFLEYFVNFIYNLYMSQISPCPSSGGSTVFMRYLVLVILNS